MVAGKVVNLIQLFVLCICEINWFFILFQISGNSATKVVHSIREDLYFEITEPESLRYTFKVRPAQNFGSPFREQLHSVGLVIAEPHHGCSAPINKLELQKNVALVERGGCSFLSKCVQADRAGVSALIVADNDIKNDEQYIDMIDDNTKRNCSIPTVFLLGKDGHMIKQRLQAHRMSRAIINIPVNVTMVPLHQRRQPPWQLW